MVKIELNWRVFFVGKTQSGKSALAKHLLKSVGNLLVYDIKREYSAFGVVVHSLDGLKRAFFDGQTRVIMQPEDVSIEFFNVVCGFVWDSLKKVLFVVDEVHNFATKSLIPENFKRIITVGQGMPYSIGVWAISQRAANVHNDIISNASAMFIFRLNLPRDAKAMSDCTGVDVVELQNLENHGFFLYSDRAEKPLERHKPLQL